MALIRRLLEKNAYLERKVTFKNCTLFRGLRAGYRSYANDSQIRGGARIGRYCSIGRRCTIGAAKHPLDWLSTHSFSYGSWPEDPTFIGNDVWIGDGAIVLGGVRIGDGAVIGAGAVVTKDVLPYAIAVGVPAKVLKYRFPEKVIERLLRLKWWELDEASLSQVPFNDIGAALDAVERILPSAKRLPDHHKPINIAFRRTVRT